MGVMMACSGSTQTARPVGSGDLITRDEIARVNAVNALEAIRALRPQMLRNRGRTNFSGVVREPVVYLDERRMGALAALQDIELQIVFQIRYYSSTHAQQKWGSGHPSGAIQVLTLRVQ
jgi:hypothetical protein